jgi:hypothetical protein
MIGVLVDRGAGLALRLSVDTEGCRHLQGRSPPVRSRGRQREARPREASGSGGGAVRTSGSPSRCPSGGSGAAGGRALARSGASDATLKDMQKSSISKQLGCGAGSAFAIALGAEIRRRRRSGGYTQRELGYPLTGAYISAIETGRCLPSVGALLLVAGRLGADPGELLTVVKGDCPDVYTPWHAWSQDQTAAHRR